MARVLPQNIGQELEVSVRRVLPKLSISMCDRHALNRRQAMWLGMCCGVSSALVTYFCDTQQGRRRRSMLRDQWTARTRRIGRGMRAIWRGAAADAYGASHRLVHWVPRESDVADDETLRQRV